MNRDTVLTLGMLFTFFVLCTDAADPIEFRLAVGTAWGSLVVADMNEQSKKISYLPARVVPVDEFGNQADALQAIAVGDDVLVTGSVSLVADSKDVATLLKASRDRIGEDVNVAQISPKVFGIWLQANGTDVWNRPVAAGKLTGIPVQFMTRAPKGADRMEMSSIVVLTWGRTIPPCGARVTFDWKALATNLDMEASTEGLVDSNILDSFAQRTIQEKWVKVDWIDGTASAPEATTSMLRAAVVSEIVRQLLQDPQPFPVEQKKLSPDGESKSKAALSLGYKYRRGVQVEMLRSTIDLSASVYLEQAVVVRGSVVVER